MSIHIHEDDAFRGRGRKATLVIGQAQGCTGGFCMGISFYASESFGLMGIHPDHEGFYVLQGEGFAKVGDEEFPVRPGSFFVALPGVGHGVRSAPGKGPVKVLWCHGAP